MIQYMAMFGQLQTATHLNTFEKYLVVKINGCD